MKCSTAARVLRYHSPLLAQHEDGIAVAPGEASRRRLAPRQPRERSVLPRSERHRREPGQREAENMLRVVNHAGTEAMAPLLVDFEAIRDLPAQQPAVRHVDPGLFAHFARCGGFDDFVAVVERPGHRLPEAGARRTLEEQYFEIGGMHDYQHRQRQLEAHDPRKSAGRESLRSGSMNTAKNGFPRPAQNSALEASTSIRMPSGSLSSVSKLRRSRTYPPASRHDRSLRQSSSASQFSPNHSGKPSACEIALNTSLHNSIFTTSRALPRAASRIALSDPARYTPERDGSCRRSSSLPITR